MWLSSRQELSPAPQATSSHFLHAVYELFPTYRADPVPDAYEADGLLRYQSGRHQAGEDEVDSGEELGAIVMHTQLPGRCASERVLLGVESFPEPRLGIEKVLPVA